MYTNGGENKPLTLVTNVSESENTHPYTKHDVDDAKNKTSSAENKSQDEDKETVGVTTSNGMTNDYYKPQKSDEDKVISITYLNHRDYSDGELNLILTLVVVPPFVIYNVLFSYMGIGIPMYAALWRTFKLSMYLIGVLFLVLFTLFSFYSDLRKWHSQIFASIVVLMTAIGLMSLGVFPHLPFVTIFLHLVIYLSCCRAYLFNRIRVCRFYFSVAIACTLIAIINLVIWILWIFTPVITGKTNMWSRETQIRFMGSMSAIHEIEGVTLEECRGRVISTTCKLIRRTNVVLWFGPLMMSLIVLFMSIFCYLRSRADKVGEDTRGRKHRKNEFVIRMFAIAVFVAVGGVWVAASVAGSSIAFSSAVQSTCVVFALVLCAWVIREFNIDSFEKASSEIPLLKEVFRVAPWDSVRGFLFCFTNVPFVVVLILNFLKQQIRSITGLSKRKGFYYFTEEFATYLESMVPWRWTAILEWAFCWNWLFIVMAILVMRICSVFLSYINDSVSEVDFVAVIAIYFAVGLCMFLLPPVPGIPVYFLGGILITSRLLKDDPEGETAFYVGIALASASGLVMKLLACAMQMGIGVLLGQNTQVRMLVGVHLVPTRAFEVILQRPGLSIPKVAVLIGGPDWPTSVMCGILRLNVFQMLLGTAPSIMLIAPTSFSAACFVFPDPNGMWSNIATAATAVAAIIQALSMLLASYYVQQIISAKGNELAKSRPEHAEVELAAKITEQRKVIYDEVTAWKVLPTFPKTFIVIVTICNSLVTWGSTFMSDISWRSFSLQDHIYDSFEKGGLNNNAIHVIRMPMGFVFLALMAVSLFGYSIYKSHVTRLVDAAVKEDRFKHLRGSRRQSNLGSLTFEQLEKNMEQAEQSQLFKPSTKQDASLTLDDENGSPSEDVIGIPESGKHESPGVAVVEICREGLDAEALPHTISS